MFKHTFKAFSFTLPIPEHGQGLKEITVDVLTSRRTNPFNADAVIWSEIDAVWCNGSDIFPLLKSELISYEDSSKGTLEEIVQGYGQRVWSGHVIPGVTYHPVNLDTKIQTNAIAEQPKGGELMLINYQRIIHAVYIDRINQSIDVKNWWFFQEPGEIKINNEPAASYGDEAYRKVYDKITEHNDPHLKDIYFCLDTDSEVMNETIAELQAV